MKTMWRAGIEKGDVSVVVLAMPKKHGEIPNVPLAVDFAKTNDARLLLKYGVHDTATITRPYFLPPGTPKERVQILRKAFSDTLKDPEFLAEAKKGNLDIEAVTGEEIETIVNDLFKLEPAWVAKLKAILVP
jgi:tripartite-type tricarboxylate transporter receptor subunit TctC